MNNIDDLLNNIIQEQFNREDEHGNDISSIARTILNLLKNLNDNPLLLEYVVCCLKNNGINIIPNRFLTVIVHKPIYDQNPNSPLANLRRMEDNPKYILDITIPHVFKSESEAEDFINDMGNFPEDRITFDDKAFMFGLSMRDLLFEKYSLRKIG